jgi:sodium-dependent dicarboxylate transporter 2/3/5
MSDQRKAAATAEARRAPPSPGPPAARGPWSRRGLLLGLGLFALVLALPAPEGMSPAAWRVAAVALLMAAWWVSEALPVAATGLVPLVLFPLLNVLPIKETASHFAHPVIFLLFGGFVIAIAMEKWNLHRRIALHVLKVAGTRPDALIAGFMVATAAISMWVSNTATTIMMLPIGLSVIALLNAGVGPGAEARDSSGGGIGPGDDRFATALLLAIAYSASIGGLGTLIGTAPNALFAAYMAEHFGVEIGFAQWMLVGVPLAVVILALAWVVLTRLAFTVGSRPVPGIDTVIESELEAMGPVSRGEKLTALVFAVVAFFWITRPALTAWFPGLPLSDPAIAMTGAVALFLIPVDPRRGVFLLDKEWTERIPWGVLVLFGGGLSLAAGISESGLAGAIGEAMQAFAHWPVVAVVLAVTAIVIFLTELTSNTATTIVFLPLATALADAVGVAPTALLVPAVAAASCAFMVPVATPPNAIVFGSGHVTIPQMARTGLFLNLGAILVITAAAYTLAGIVFAAGG